MFRAFKLAEFSSSAVLSINHESMTVEEVEEIIGLKCWHPMRMGEIIPNTRTAMDYTSVAYNSAEFLDRAKPIGAHLDRLLELLEGRTPAIRNIQQSGGWLSIRLHLRGESDYKWIDLSASQLAVVGRLGIKLKLVCSID